MIAQETLTRIKTDVFIVDVVGHFIKLTRRGATYLGTCPFHDERTPSLAIHKAKNAYKCFGCGASGDAIDFVMKYKGVTFAESVQLIAAITGITIEVDDKRTERTERTFSAKPHHMKSEASFDTIPAHLLLLDTIEADIKANPLTHQQITLTNYDIVAEVLQDYSISIDDDYVCFLQRDFNGRIRTGKSLRYRAGAKRDGSTPPKWVHSELKRKGILPESFRLRQCFTGEHLISANPGKTIAIVEGQSTMLFMAVLSKAAKRYNIKALKAFEDYVWISTGGSDGVGWKNEQVTSVLKGCSVVLMPDAGFYDKWLKDAEIMEEYGVKVAVSDFIERKYRAGQLQYNQDLRDYFMQFATEIKELCTPILEISTTEIMDIPVETKTGKDFGHLVLATLWLKDGRIYDVLFDQEGELVTVHEKIAPLASFFQKSFIPGKLNGADCLINIVTQ